MFKFMNLLGITATPLEPYVSPEEVAREAQELQDKKIWLAILITLLAAEIIFAVVYPKIKAKRKAKAAETAQRKKKHSKKKK